MSGPVADCNDPYKILKATKICKEFIYPDKTVDKLHKKHTRVSKNFLLYFLAAKPQYNPANAKLILENPPDIRP